MKRFSLEFAVLFVLFSFQGGFSRPTKSQLDSLEALQPVFDTTANEISYDSLESYGPITEDTVTNEDYWIAVRFTPTISAFDLQVVYFQVLNSLINTVDGCSIIVMSDSIQLPDSVLLINTVPAPLANRLRSLALSDTLEFGQNESFWVLLGPVPGGFDTDSIGDGWWALGADADRPPDSVNSNKATRSFVRLDNQFSDDAGWIQYSQANWVIRAGGEFSEPPPPVINEVMFAADPSSTDPTRNHEWVELYNPGTLLNAAGWQIHKGNQQNPYTLDTFPFNSGAYMVVHFVSGTPPSNDLDLSDLRGDIYINASNVFDDMNDACALRIPGAIKELADIVAWNLKHLSTDNDSAITALEGNNPVAFNPLNKVRRIQPFGGIGPLLTATKGISIGRDSSSSNPNSSLNGGNLHFVGGKNAAGPTMGKKNSLSMVVDISSIDSSAVANADWTVMLYFAADNGSGADAQERWCYDLLNRIEREIAPNPQSQLIKLNVLVWFDSRSVYPKDAPAQAGTVFQGILRHDVTDTVHNLVPVGEKNSGDSASLRKFITWARTNYPASNYMLALKGDGAGWQGLCGDADVSDRLQMGELDSALQAGLEGGMLHLLILDAPLMSQLEVAAQIKNHADFMVASPEMTGPADFDYSQLVKKLQGGGLAPAIPDTIPKSVVGEILENTRTQSDKFWMWIALRLDNDSMSLVLNRLQDLAVYMRQGIEDRCAIGNAVDNFQLYVRRHLVSSDHYGGQAQGMADFVDLRNLSFNLGSEIDYFQNSCNRDSIGDYGFSLHNRLGIKQEFGSQQTIIVAQSPHPDLTTSMNSRHFGGGGVSIYFPSSRQNYPPIPAAQKITSGPLPVAPPVFSSGSEHSFDAPGLAVEGGAAYGTLLYAADDSACYPHPDGPCSTYSANLTYPHPALQGFDFVDSTGWDEFLIRYYKPVADAGGPYGAANVGAPLSPALNGSGSSDADDQLDPSKFFWDLDAGSDDNPGNCNAYSSEDMDKNCSDDDDDESDISGITASAVFQIPGPFDITLNVWDGYDASKPVDNNRRYQTAKSTASITVNNPNGFLVEEDNFSDLSPTLPTDFTKNRLQRIPNVSINKRPLLTCVDKEDPNLLKFVAPDDNPIFWQTGRVNSCLFPNTSRDTLKARLDDVANRRGVWVFAPKLAEDVDYQSGPLKPFFKEHFGLDTARTTSLTSTRLHVAAGIDSLPIFAGLDTTGVHFPIYLRTNPPSLVVALESLQVRPIQAKRYPLLRDDNGSVVAMAFIEDFGGGQKRGRILSTFGLEHIRLDNTSDTTKLDTLLSRLYDWMFNPTERILPPSACVKGDLDGSGLPLSPSDVALALLCIFSGTRCDTCAADVVGCDGNLGPSDLSHLLLMVFNGAPSLCTSLFREEAFKAIEQKPEKVVFDGMEAR
ncbi:MAG: clostripain-related cysteine peptidase [candidate division Zixibacteria bacterium]|nr:clostripain-related cysteine peptidase [candidate division Zixibacteria bacterium]